MSQNIYPQLIYYKPSVFQKTNCRLTLYKELKKLNNDFQQLSIVIIKFMSKKTTKKCNGSPMNCIVDQINNGFLKIGIMSITEGNMVKQNKRDWTKLNELN